MRVLWHLSHHRSGSPDGWSGAPDEARWVREDLTPRVQARTWAMGIVLVLVDGDLKDHLPFHEDYDAFVAPHYEADVHGEGGSFWGRAGTSVTAAADDRLGAIFWRRYSQLVGRPPDRFGWSNPNVTDYYGFRFTSPKTPGILVEHGVGAPGAPDHDWLRANVDAIADTWALALAEFGGIKKEALVAKSPERMGQSAAFVEIPQGEHALLQATYQYEPEPSGEARGRTIVKKVTGSRIGARSIVIYPPVDPDDDETMDLDAEPSLFLVNVLPQT